MVKVIAPAALREGALNAWSGRLRSALDLRYLVVLSAIATYALIVLGGTVRVTDSGLACPDWPRCHGQLIPPMETKIMIEYSHRVAAASVGLLIAGTAAVAWLWHRDKRDVLVGASAALLLLIGQALLGGVTVNMELPDTVVALHLAVALVLLAVLVATAVAAVRHERPARAAASDRGVPPLAAAAALATLALIVIGSYVANSGAALVYPDWPLFNGKLASAGGRLADLHYAHRLMAVVVGLLVVALAVRVWRKRGGTALMAVMGFAVAVYVAQVFVGAGNIWLNLADSVRVAHLALAAALWGALVFVASWAYAELTANEAEAG